MRPGRILLASPNGITVDMPVSDSSQIYCALRVPVKNCQFVILALHKNKTLWTF